jgi:hypothetical protein
MATNNGSATISWNASAAASITNVIAGPPSKSVVIDWIHVGVNAAAANTVAAKIQVPMPNSASSAELYGPITASSTSGCQYEFPGGMLCRMTSNSVTITTSLVVAAGTAAGAAGTLSVAIGYHWE